MPRPARRPYLAYGSNLNWSAMRERCPGAKPDSWLMLEHARLVFRRCADVAVEVGHATPCGVWHITADDEEALDRYEGVEYGLYEKCEVDIGERKPALIYLMNDRGVAPPSQYYLDVIRRGYRDFGLDETFLDAAVAYAWTGKDESAFTIRRRARDRRYASTRRVAQVPEEVALRRLG